MQQVIIDVPVAPPGMTHTAKGFLPTSSLRIETIEQDYPDALIVATEYYDETGEQVRRDVEARLKQKDFFQFTAKEM